MKSFIIAAACLVACTYAASEKNAHFPEGGFQPPGIYNQDSLKELFRRRRYEEVEPPPPAPVLPDWCGEEEKGFSGDVVRISQNTSSPNPPKNEGKERKERTFKKAAFKPKVQGVEPFETQPRLNEIQKKIHQFCDWKSTGFPGSHPLSMDTKNILKLHEKAYRVSWKPDGVRYMMLIDGEDEVYMFDRDFCGFKVSGLRFPHRKDLKRHLKNTLLDGEMVLDIVDNKRIPRYLCYDIIALEGNDISRMEFYPTRLQYIENEIVNPRNLAIKEGIINKELEPFSVESKQFWDITMTRQLLDEKFVKTLHHEIDGLIFMPAKERYVPGPFRNELKWKPLEKNSIDFMLKIDTRGGEGVPPNEIGYLYVYKLDKPFASMEVTEEIKHLDNKIIECTYENGKWIFLRERTDKSCPNSYSTSALVFESISVPVTEEMLLDYIDNHRFQGD